jgi:hypothetical protein
MARDFEDSTLWRVSAFDLMRATTGTTGYARPPDSATVLSSTLLADLDRLEIDLGRGDLLQVMAACLRQREAALLYLQHEGLVWPVTLFPAHDLYHSPRDLLEAGNLADLSIITIEPPGVRPPGHWMHERVAHGEHYRRLAPLLWAVALHGPRSTLLKEIGGTAAYRASPQRLPAEMVAPGAIGSAAERLRHESVALRTIAGWPGMSVERANRLLNGLYVASRLVVTRTHHAARGEPGTAKGWLEGLIRRH